MKYYLVDANVQIKKLVSAKIRNPCFLKMAT